MGWGNFAEKITNIIDGLLGLSPEQKKIKIRNKIDNLERERDALLKEPPSFDSSHKLSDIDDKLDRLREILKNS